MTSVTAVTTTNRPQAVTAHTAVIRATVCALKVLSTVENQHMTPAHKLKRGCQLTVDDAMRFVFFEKLFFQAVTELLHNRYIIVTESLRRSSSCRSWML